VKRGVSSAFWVESGLASFTAFLVVLTAAWHDWVEGIFGFDPDHHNGSFEWELVVACCLLTAVFGFMARREWRRTAMTPTV
jgi:hypothetical protein